MKKRSKRQKKGKGRSRENIRPLDFVDCNNSGPSSPTRKGFLDLPGEVRNKIYEFLLTFDGCSGLTCNRTRFRITADLGRGLLLANKQLYHEAFSILIGQNAVVLGWVQLTDLFRRRRFHFDCIQFLELDYLWLNFQFSRPQTGESPERWIAILTSLPKLRKLHVDVFEMLFYDRISSHGPGYIANDCFRDWMEQKQEVAACQNLEEQHKKLMGFEFKMTEMVIVCQEHIHFTAGGTHTELPTSLPQLFRLVAEMLHGDDTS
ncbi:hypothetical protein IWZ01DRAFT_147309 [Phyllosticta capitalensis]